MLNWIKKYIKKPIIVNRQSMEDIAFKIDISNYIIEVDYEIQKRAKAGSKGVSIKSTPLVLEKLEEHYKTLGFKVEKPSDSVIKIYWIF